ncbi:unnamed protein product [Boreogadus saida]
MELTVSGDIKSPAPGASARNPDQPEPPDPSATSPLTLQRVGGDGARDSRVPWTRGIVQRLYGRCATAASLHDTSGAGERDT